MPERLHPGDLDESEFPEQLWDDFEGQPPTDQEQLTANQILQQHEPQLPDGFDWNQPPSLGFLDASGMQEPQPAYLYGDPRHNIPAFGANPAQFVPQPATPNPHVFGEDRQMLGVPSDRLEVQPSHSASCDLGHCYNDIFRGNVEAQANQSFASELGNQSTTALMGDYDFLGALATPSAPLSCFGYGFPQMMYTHLDAQKNSPRQQRYPWLHLEDPKEIHHAKVKYVEKLHFDLAGDDTWTFAKAISDASLGRTLKHKDLREIRKKRTHRSTTWYCSNNASRPKQTFWYTDVDGTPRLCSYCLGKNEECKPSGGGRSNPRPWVELTIPEDTELSERQKKWLNDETLVFSAPAAVSGQYEEDDLSLERNDATNSLDESSLGDDNFEEQRNGTSPHEQGKTLYLKSTFKDLSFMMKTDVLSLASTVNPRARALWEWLSTYGILRDHLAENTQLRQALDGRYEALEKKFSTRCEKCTRSGGRNYCELIKDAGAGEQTSLCRACHRLWPNASHCIDSNRKAVPEAEVAKQGKVASED